MHLDLWDLCLTFDAQMLEFKWMLAFNKWLKCTKLVSLNNKYHFYIFPFWIDSVANICYAVLYMHLCCASATTSHCRLGMRPQWRAVSSKQGHVDSTRRRNQMKPANKEPFKLTVMRTERFCVLTFGIWKRVMFKVLITASKGFKGTQLIILCFPPQKNIPKSVARY